MKKLLAIIVLVFLCFSLTSCEVVELLKYSITGELMEPIEGFSYGEEKGTFIYKGIKYIDVREINGDCRIATPWDYVLLGMRSNWPLFPATQYLAPPTDDPSFITNGHGTAVYLREDLYHSEIMYVLNDTSFEFNFEDAFIKTDKIDYDHHEASEKSTQGAIVNFYMKEIPEIKVMKNLYLIDNVWYCVDYNVAYQLSDEFYSQLIEAGVIK